MTEKIDRKYLIGLKFKASEGRTVTKDGRDVIEYVTVERALKPEDVIGWRDTGPEIIIVTADGHKSTISKGG